MDAYTAIKLATVICVVSAVFCLVSALGIVIGIVLLQHAADVTKEVTGGDGL